MLEIIQRHTDARVNLKGNRAHVVDLILVVTMVIVVIGGRQNPDLVPLFPQLGDQIDN